MYAILIQNARVADGTGNPIYQADVAVKDGKIARIGYALTVQAKKPSTGPERCWLPALSTPTAIWTSASRQCPTAPTC